MLLAWPSPLARDAGQRKGRPGGGGLSDIQ